MGNCLKTSNSDDISLLRGTEINSVPDFPIDQNVSPTHGDFIQPLFIPSPPISRPISTLSEEEQVKMAKRMDLIHHLPMGTYDGTKKLRECVICMIDFCVNEPVRYLPCMHIYHVQCIDSWLMRSLTCPSCMEPVDSALLTSYDTS